MPKPDSDYTVTPSVLDRLVDREPGMATDPPVTRARSLADFKKSLRRDMEWLLNTRRNPEAAKFESTDVGRSLRGYGLPDFSALTLNSPRDRTQLLTELEQTVASFEPRLKNVRVSLVETPERGSRILNFQIEGSLDFGSSRELVAFDTTLQLSSGEYQIRGERSA